MNMRNILFIGGIPWWGTTLIALGGSCPLDLPILYPEGTSEHKAKHPVDPAPRRRLYLAYPIPLGSRLGGAADFQATPSTRSPPGLLAKHGSSIKPRRGW